MARETLRDVCEPEHTYLFGQVAKRFAPQVRRLCPGYAHPPGELGRLHREVPRQHPSAETRDFYLACFLRCTGYELVDLRAEGRRKVFVFRDRPTRRDDVMAFYGDGATVRPLAFAATIKDMKGLLHNG